MTKISNIDDWVLQPSSDTHCKVYYNATANISKWIGYPDSNYSFDNSSFSWERTVKDEEGKDVLVKTTKDSIEIIADLQPVSTIELASVEVTQANSKKYGAMKGFVWIDNVIGGGEVLLPFTSPHIFKATGTKTNPVLIELGTDDTAQDYYKIEDGKTRVFVSSFSGIGGSGNIPPTLIAHYKMNDNLATDVILDETGNHNGAVKDAGGTATSAFHSVAGKINLAQEFDGSDDYIEIPDHSDFTPALTPFSIAVWVNADDATQFGFTSKGAFTGDIDGEYRAFTTSGDNIRIRIVDSTASSYIGRQGSVLPENQWCFIVLTYDGGTTSSSCKIYKNSIRDDDTDHESNPGAFVSVRNSAVDILIGKFATFEANGTIDVISFYSQVLDQSDVDYLYNAGSGREEFSDYRPRYIGRTGYRDYRNRY